MTRTVIIPTDCYPLTWPLGVARTKSPVRSSFNPRTYSAAVREVRDELAKDADATHAELAKARDEGKTATIAKAVAAVPLVKGASLIVKAIHLLPDAERAEALADLATVNASLGVVTKSVGRGAAVESDTDPKVVLEKAAATFAKSNPTLTAIEARREFGRSEEGQRLYAEAYPLDTMQTGGGM